MEKCSHVEDYSCEKGIFTSFEHKNKRKIINESKEFCS